MILGALVNVDRKFQGLDIGAGTGVLSLMITQQNPNITFDAIEIDAESAKDCALNFTESLWSDRLSVFTSDFLSFEFKKKYDLIISNPPFYHNGLLNQNERTARSKHAEHLPFDQLFQKVTDILTDDGHFWIVFPFELAVMMENIGNSVGLLVENQYSIEGKPSKPTRVIFSFCKNVRSNKQKVIEKIIIRDENGSYSNQYIALTEDFHNKKPI